MVKYLLQLLKVVLAYTILSIDCGYSVNKNNGKITYHKLNKQSNDQEQLQDILSNIIGSTMQDISTKPNVKLLAIGDHYYLLLYYAESEEHVIPVLIRTQCIGAYTLCKSYLILRRNRNMIDSEYHTQYKQHIEHECSDMYKNIKRAVKDMVHEQIKSIKSDMFSS